MRAPIDPPRLRSFFALAALILMGLYPIGCARHQPPEARAADRGHGGDLFAKNCLPCHGSSPDAARIGPSLVNEGHKRSYAQIVRAIEAPDPPMPKLYPGTLTEADVADIAAYVKNL
jgi:mono/diheme cytochrome c family protein